MTCTVKEAIEARQAAEDNINKAIEHELKAFNETTGLNITSFESEVYLYDTFVDDELRVNVKLGVELK